jgi:hypothetical protein
MPSLLMIGSKMDLEVNNYLAANQMVNINYQMILCLFILA